MDVVSQEGLNIGAEVSGLVFGDDAEAQMTVTGTFQPCQLLCRGD